jgi:hypothetical protein
VFLEATFLQNDGAQLNGIDRAMDLLLGILTYAAWGWDHAQLPRFVLLARSLVGEMRLDKPAPPNMDTLALLTPGLGGWDDTRSERIMAQHSLERQRAVLACFVLSSAVATYSGQVDALRWTSQMGEGLVAISASTECPTDAALALQVRLQLLAENALHIRSQSSPTSHAAAEALLAQLRQLQPAIQQHQSTLHTATTAASLSAQAHHTESIILSALHATTTSTPLNHPPPQQSPLRAIQSCTTTHLALTAPAVRGMSFTQWAHLTLSLAALQRLDSSPDSRAVVDLPVLLDRLGEKLDVAAREEGGEESVFARLAGGVRAFREGVVGGRGERGDDGEGGGGLERVVVMAPQKGFFRNPRFWMDRIFTGVPGVD